MEKPLPINDLKYKLGERATHDFIRQELPSSVSLDFFCDLKINCINRVLERRDPLHLHECGHWVGTVIDPETAKKYLPKKYLRKHFFLDMTPMEMAEYTRAQAKKNG